MRYGKVLNTWHLPNKIVATIFIVISFLYQHLPRTGLGQGWGRWKMGVWVGLPEVHSVSHDGCA